MLPCHRKIVGVKVNCKKGQFSWFRGLKVPGKNWPLNPSDFAFLGEECKSCFYLKIVAGFRRPGGPMLKIFYVIDAQVKVYFSASFDRSIGD